VFLADRNILIDQMMVNDFRPLTGKMAKLSTRSKTIERNDGMTVGTTLSFDRHRRIVASDEIYLGAVSGDHRA
jgi:type I restriction enzyme R subunit